MILAKSSAGALIRSTAGVEAYCPGCEARVRAKCGTIVIHHFAHFKANPECTYGPESAWHLRWKDHALSMGWDVEVSFVGPDGTKHRADIVTDRGNVIELQHSTLPIEKIKARERAYGADRLKWIYDAGTILKGRGDDIDLSHRLTVRKSWEGGASFRIRNGPKRMTHHEADIYWHLDRPTGREALWKVKVETNPAGVYGYYNDVTEAWARWIPPPAVPAWLTAAIPSDRSRHPAIEREVWAIAPLTYPELTETETRAEIRAVMAAPDDEKLDQLMRSSFSLAQLQGNEPTSEQSDLDRINLDFLEELLPIVAQEAGIPKDAAQEAIDAGLAAGLRAPRWIR